MVLIPHGASKSDFVWACHYFGLTGAQELRFSLSEAENGFLEPQSIQGGGPTVFVAYPKDIRGLDLKRINIVFMMGEFGTVEDYVHITGRTGRHRPGGSVITILEESTDNLSQKLLNVAIKLVRTGSRPAHWALPAIEIDLKPLPGDKYELIRSEAGIVTRTEEVRLKEEREKKSEEERKRWLQMEGVVEQEPEEPDVDEETESRLERPVSFGMEAPSLYTPVEQDHAILDIGELDWRDALAQSLKHSAPTPTPTGTEPKSVDRVLVDSPVSDEDVDEDLEDPDADVIQPATEATTTTIKQLETFGGIPAFPREAIKEAQKSLKGYYKHVLSKDDANSTSSSNSISPTTVEGAQVSESAIPPEALLPNQAVLRRQDEPILPHTNNLTTESSPEELKIVMEGESLRQLEESHIISPAKETGKSKEEKPPDEPAEAPKPKRGRPKKNTPEV
jgi:superfamily II DNA/RNA helicase